jgi:hypothetical protein
MLRNWHDRHYPYGYEVVGVRHILKQLSLSKNDNQHGLLVLVVLVDSWAGLYCSCKDDDDKETMKLT